MTMNSEKRSSSVFAERVRSHRLRNKTFSKFTNGLWFVNVFITLLCSWRPKPTGSKHQKEFEFVCCVIRETHISQYMFIIHFIRNKIII